MQSIICFVSDFGLEDTWVGVCHAVIHASCPQARIVDLAHQIPSFDLRKGAAVAAAGVFQLPEAIHLVVVDPGVGGDRTDLCLLTERGTRLVGPDNGVLLPAANRSGGIREAFAIDSEKIGSQRPLATFHARDVLAPAVAALACGANPSELGAPISSAELVSGPYESCHREGEYVVAEVVDIDKFGSIRLGIGVDQLEELALIGDSLEISIGHNVIEVPFAATFSDVSMGEPVALVDSSGWVSLSLRQSSAAERYGVEPGALTRVRLT